MRDRGLGLLATIRGVASIAFPTIGGGFGETAINQNFVRIASAKSDALEGGNCGDLLFGQVAAEAGHSAGDRLGGVSVAVVSRRLEP